MNKPNTFSPSIPSTTIPALTEEKAVELRSKLLAEKDRLLLRMEPKDSLNRANWNPDRGELATSASNMERRQALDEIDAQEFAQVESALVRMEAGTYGLCKTCGERIHPDRLAIIPSADQCAGCRAE